MWRVAGLRRDVAVATREEPHGGKGTGHAGEHEGGMALAASGIPSQASPNAGEAIRIESSPGLALESVKLMAPIVPARNIFCVGKNYRAHAKEYPWDVAKKMAAQGLLGITVKEADGGQGGTLMDAVIAIEAVAASCPRSADVVQAGNFGAIRVLAEYGTPAQKERFLKRLLAGEGVISVGMTEPEAGSAVTDLTTTARR